MGATSIMYLKEESLAGMWYVQILHNIFSKYEPTKIYNLDAITIVVYLIKNQEDIQFRNGAVFLRQPHYVHSKRENKLNQTSLLSNGHTH